MHKVLVIEFISKHAITIEYDKDKFNSKSNIEISIKELIAFFILLILLTESTIFTDYCNKNNINEEFISELFEHLVKSGAFNQFKNDYASLVSSDSLS